MRKDPRAFTLIEILMAMMVLSVGLASVLSVFVVGLRASRRVVDESAAAVVAKAALARVLSEDLVMPDGSAGSDGVRDFLHIIADERGELLEPACDWVWIHNKEVRYSGTFGGAEDDNVVPAPVEIAENSRFSWRCRASRFRGAPGKPRDDLVLEGSTDPVPLTQGRVPSSQQSNPDSEELWRLTIEVYRDWAKGRKPLASFETYVCLAHR